MGDKECGSKNCVYQVYFSLQKFGYCIVFKENFRGRGIINQSINLNQLMYLNTYSCEIGFPGSLSLTATPGNKTGCSGTVRVGLEVMSAVGFRAFAAAALNIASLWCFAIIGKIIAFLTTTLSEGSGRLRTEIAESSTDKRRSVSADSPPPSSCSGREVFFPLDVVVPDFPRLKLFSFS